MDFISLFLKDQIVINNKKYTRTDFEKIAKDNRLEIKDHPTEKNWKYIELTNKGTANAIEYRYAMLASNKGTVMDMTLYPNALNPIIAACTVRCKPEIYDSPFGTMCDYQLAKDKKISIGPNGSMIYLWDC